MSLLYSYGAQSLFLWQETDYWWFPVFLVVVTTPCFCRVGFDTITPNWFKHGECSSVGNTVLLRPFVRGV